MRSLAALLAAVLCGLAGASCADDGAEPGASREATLVLDFQPNAVHAGIYAAERRGFFADEGLELEIREPSSSTDAPKLLEAGRAELAVLDIHDFGLAVERGFELHLVAALVARPLAAVIAGDREAVRRPRDLEGGTVGVTGLPSDDAVLDAVLEADGADPTDVDRVTIGFESVPALAAGRVDAATAFWNAEGVALRRRGVPTREFRVDRYGARPYPELVVVTAADPEDEAAREAAGVEAFRTALARGYELLASDPDAALADLLAAVPGLDPAAQRAQFSALRAAQAFGHEIERRAIANWLRFAGAGGIIDRKAVAARVGPR